MGQGKCSDSNTSHYHLKLQSLKPKGLPSLHPKYIIPGGIKAPPLNHQKEKDSSSILILYFYLTISWVIKFDCNRSVARLNGANYFEIFEKNCTRG